MKIALAALALSGLHFFVPCAAAADKTEKTPVVGDSAEAIVQMVHMSRAMQNGDVLNGELNKAGAITPFVVKFEQNLIHFSFDNPKQIIKLDITEKGYRLKEVTAGSNREVPAAMYSAGVRGTDLTYDDVSFRYLYWPQKEKIGEEVIKTRRCYVVDLKNPQRLGDYYLVRIFVDKESGGLMRMQAYDWNGKLTKSCTVTAGMKMPNGATMLKSMEVVRYVPGTKKVAGETTFELKKPGK